MRRVIGCQEIRSCLRPDPEIYRYNEEEEEEEEEQEEEIPYRTVFIDLTREKEGERIIGAQILNDANARDFEKVIALASNSNVDDLKLKVQIKKGELKDVAHMTSKEFKEGKYFYYSNGDVSCSVNDFRTKPLEIVKTFSGKIYDGMECKVMLLKSQKELDDFAEKWILKSHPKFQPGVRKIIGSTPSQDPLLTGKAKIEFDKQFLLIVFGQRIVEKVSWDMNECLHVYWRYDWTKRTSNTYGAALVTRLKDTDVTAVKIPEKEYMLTPFTLSLRWMLVAPPRSMNRLGLRPMASSHPIRRGRVGPPMTHAALLSRTSKMRSRGGGRKTAPLKRKSPQNVLRRSKRIAKMKEKKKQCGIE